MKAWLVVNAFLQQKKFDEIHQWLYEAGKKDGIDIEIKTNAQLLVQMQKDRLEVAAMEEAVDFVLFWDKDVILAKALEKLSLPIFNGSFAIESCDNKALTHLYLASAGIPMPKTMVAPMTYANIGYTNQDFLEKVEKNLGLPMVVKECYGSFGQQVYLCKTREELQQKTVELQGKDFLYQQYIESSSGHDVRLQVVGDQVVTAMERFAKDGDFRANITNGGTMKSYVPSEEEKRLAVRCCEILKADFAGVDLLFLEDGTPIVCEVNSNAHFKNIFDCTGVNTAEYIIKLIKKKIQMLHNENSEGM